MLLMVIMLTNYNCSLSSMTVAYGKEGLKTPLIFALNAAFPSVRQKQEQLGRLYSLKNISQYFEKIFNNVYFFKVHKYYRKLLNSERCGA